MKRHQDKFLCTILSLANKYPCIVSLSGPGVLHHGDLAACADWRLHYRGASEVSEVALPGELPVVGLGAAAGGSGWGLHLPLLHAYLLRFHARFLRHHQRAQPGHHRCGSGAVHSPVHLCAGWAVSPCRQRFTGNTCYSLFR